MRQWYVATRAMQFGPFPSEAVAKEFVEWMWKYYIPCFQWTVITHKDK